MDLQTQLDQAQIILAWVLHVTGPVDVSKALMAEGLPEGAIIAINEDKTKDCLTLSLEVQK